MAINSVAHQQAFLRLQAIRQAQEAQRRAEAAAKKAAELQKKQQQAAQQRQLSQSRFVDAPGDRRTQDRRVQNASVEVDRRQGDRRAETLEVEPSWSPAASDGIAMGSGTGEESLNVAGNETRESADRAAAASSEAAGKQESSGSRTAGEAASTAATGAAETATAEAGKPTAEPAIPTSFLEPGATGVEVEQYQSLLFELGYLTGEYEPGTYDAATVEAVTAMQHDMVAAGLMEEGGLATGPGFTGPRTQYALHTVLETGADLTMLAPYAPGGALHVPGDTTDAVSAQRMSFQQTGFSDENAEAAQAGDAAPYSGGPTGTWNPAFYVDQLAWANSGSNCGPANFLMHAKRAGLMPTGDDGTWIAESRRMLGTTDMGTGPDDWVAQAEAFGLNPTMTNIENNPENVDIAAIKQALAEGKGVVVTVECVLGGQPVGHYVTIEGVDADGNFLIADPAGILPRVMTPQELVYDIDPATGIATGIAANDGNGGRVIILDYTPVS